MNVQRASVVLLVIFAVAFIACSGADIARRSGEQSSPSPTPEPSSAFDGWRFLPSFAKLSVAPSIAVAPFGSVTIGVPASSQQYRLVRYLPVTGTPMQVTYPDVTSSANKTESLVPGRRDTLLLPSQASQIQLSCESTATCVVSTL